MNEMLALQTKVADLYQQRSYTAGPQTLLLGAMEELGELAEAILLTQASDFKPFGKKLSPAYIGECNPALEIGDCITYLLALCNSLGISPYFKWLE